MKNKIFFSQSLLVRSIFAATTAMHSVALYAVADHTQADHMETATSTKKRLQEVEVHAHPLSAEGLAQPFEVLDGDDLARAASPSLGETVANLPGVRSQSFGEAVGRPIIHGLSGVRVRVMEDRVDSLDVSVSSTDHATSVEAFMADRIEVLKGASTLLYGSGAIGGVVDVHSGRIPHRAPAKAVTGRAEVRYRDNADKTSSAIRLDGGADSFAWHVDGFHREANDYRVPGSAESVAQLASEGEVLEVFSDSRVLGSRYQQQGGALGASWLMDRGFMGVAVSRREAAYGLPGHEEAGAAAPPMLDQEQWRYDVEAGYQPAAEAIENINLRGAYNNYQHVELEDGAVGTQFENDAWELRAEAAMVPVNHWTTVLGLQFGEREYSVIGDEAYVPPVDTRSQAVFGLAQTHFSLASIDDAKIEMGWRYEHVEHEPDTVTSSPRRFDNVSGSVGIIVPITDALTSTLQVDYAQRAPVAEALYSDGPHLATQSYDIGNDQLKTERAWYYSAGVEWDVQAFSASATGYFIDFERFVFQLPDIDAGGAVILVDDLPVLRYTQAPARFYGLDLQLEKQLVEWRGGSFGVRMGYDFVHAERSGGVALPRIPADRMMAEMIITQRALTTILSYANQAKQDRLSELELATEKYDDLSLLLEFKQAYADMAMTYFVQGSNLTNDEQRNHSSFIKDFVPSPGRSVEVGLRLSF